MNSVQRGEPVIGNDHCGPRKATCQCPSVPAASAEQCHVPVPHQCHISVHTSAHQ
ncbi:unnamed protein product, partial [Staurois parvus]